MSARHPCQTCGNELCLSHCVYCGEPVDVAPHSPTCPEETGIYPVRPQDVECHGGCGCITGLRCAQCDAELKVGDSYAYLPIHVPAFEVVAARTVVVACLGCAAAGPVEE